MRWMKCDVRILQMGILNGVRSVPMPFIKNTGAKCPACTAPYGNSRPLTQDLPVHHMTEVLGLADQYTLDSLQHVCASGVTLGRSLALQFVPVLGVGLRGTVEEKTARTLRKPNGLP